MRINCKTVNKKSRIKFIDTNLCVITSDLDKDVDEIKKLIRLNQSTEFWLSTNNLQRRKILLAKELGINNIIPNPYDSNLITDYMNKKQNLTDSQELYYQDSMEEMKVMIADSNKFNSDLLKNLLGEWGVKITAISDEKTAIETIKNEKFDLFILDILMQKITGFELASIISESCLNSDVPMIFMSNLSDTDNKIAAYSSGASLYIEKPFDVNLVKMQIYSILKNRRLKKKLDEEKEHFIAAISHDLRGPIVAGIYALEMILDKDASNLTEHQGEIVKNVIGSAKYMKIMTDNLLCKFRGNKNMHELHKTNCCLKNIIELCIAELQYITMTKGQIIKFLCNEKDTIVFADCIEIKRVICNLINNASEYSPDNGIITINLNQESDKFIVEIQDNGYGIKNVDGILDKYISFAKEHKKVGFGLGLCICKKIIEKHDGEITIESIVGKGTTVKFTLPKQSK